MFLNKYFRVCVWKLGVLFQRPQPFTSTTRTTEIPQIHWPSCFLQWALFRQMMKKGEFWNKFSKYEFNSKFNNDMWTLSQKVWFCVSVSLEMGGLEAIVLISRDIRDQTSARGWWWIEGRKLFYTTQADVIVEIQCIKTMTFNTYKINVNQQRTAKQLFMLLFAIGSLKLWGCCWKKVVATIHM